MKNAESTFDVTSAIIAFEDGSLPEPEIIELFQHLVDTGLAWQLQGMYGRQAARMLQDGLIVDHNKLSTK